jgi:hypothetical protein
MDLISLFIFLATFGLISAMLVLDLHRYKFHFLAGIVFLGVALYSYGLTYNQSSLNAVDIILKAFGNTSQILRGIFRTNDISDRINNDILFLISAYAIHVLGFGYTYILIFAIFFRNLGLRARFNFQKSKPHFLILGNDEKLTFLLQSYQREFLSKPWHQRNKLKRLNLALPKALLTTKEIKTKYAFNPGVSPFDVENQEIESLLGRGNKEVIIVSLLTNDRDVLTLVEQFNRYFKKRPKSKLHVYMMYEDKQHLSVYESFSEEKQRIQFFSYHQLIAQQLILEYPITSFIPQTFIDTERATLQDVVIKYHLFGFGPTNQEIYRHLFVTNQFPPSVSKFIGKEFTNYQKHPIRYVIYSDSEMSPPTYGDFLTSTTNKKDALPLPPLSATTKWITSSFVQNEYIQSLHTEVNNNHDYQCLVIAFGDDVINLRVLQQVIDWITQRRLVHYRVFVQMLNRDYVKSSHLFKQPNVTPFGFGDYGYSLNQIINPVFTKIASQIHETLHPDKPFNQLVNQEKETLLYEAISLRFKLNLMGLDLAVNQKGIKESTFMNRYDPSEEARFHQSHPRAKNDADLSRYKPTLKKKRNLLARQEHLRWTAYKVVQGYIPMSMSEMMTTNRYVDHLLKKDGRLTSFDGLFDLHQFLVDELGYRFSDADLIYPFFHTMDHLYKIIKNTPYQIVDVIDPSNNQTIELGLEDLSTNVDATIKEK